MSNWRDQSERDLELSNSPNKSESNLNKKKITKISPVIYGLIIFLLSFFLYTY